MKLGKLLSVNYFTGKVHVKLGREYCRVSFTDRSTCHTRCMCQSFVSAQAPRSQLPPIERQGSNINSISSLKGAWGGGLSLHRLDWERVHRKVAWRLNYTNVWENLNPPKNAVKSGLCLWRQLRGSNNRMTSRYLQFGLLLNACFSLEGAVGTNIFLHKFCPILFSTCTLLFLQ